MSQYDPGTIDPNTKDGASLATDINNWRDALHSSHRGSTSPGYASAGMLWIDDSGGTNWELKFYDGADWISLFTIDTANNTSNTGLKNNLAATTAPTANDDTNDGYSVGSVWIDIANDNTYLCIDATATSSIWTQTNASGQSGAITGSIVIWPLATPPTGHLECNGNAISRTTYATLFTIIGTAYGTGDGSTTFNLPDYRGEFLRGFDNSAGIDPDAASRTDRGDGTAGNNIGTKQTDDFKSHQHGVLYTAGTRIGGFPSANGSGFYNPYTEQSLATGGNETRPRNINVMYCIKY